jgi:hypothetical protein
MTPLRIMTPVASYRLYRTEVQWGDLPTWVAAIGTVGAFAAAFIQIGTERHERLARQEQDRLEARRAQARLISAVLGPVEHPDPEPDLDKSDIGDKNVARLHFGRTAIDLLNTSQEPVYALVAGIVFIQGAGAPRTIKEDLQLRQRGVGVGPQSCTTVSLLPPGKHRVWVRGDRHGGVLSGRLAAEVAFTDRDGVHWVRHATGPLEELPEAPLDYYRRYNLYGPHELQTPEPVQ